MKILITAVGAVLILVTATLVIGTPADHLPAIHAIHGELELECADCHEGVTESTRGSDDLLPAKDLCAECHDVEAVDECAMCHSDPEHATALSRRTERAQNYNHSVHLGLDLVCADCHGDAVTGEPERAEMALCRTCHETSGGGDDCLLCHADGEDLLPSDHRAGWEWFHGGEARVNEASCANCHVQSECQDCHAGDNVRPRAHGLNYEFRHALDAKGNDMDCAACHSEPQFCAGCHLANQVLPESHSRGDWLGSRGGRHAEDAIFEMESCIACHDQGAAAPICAECHGE